MDEKPTLFKMLSGVRNPLLRLWVREKKREDAPLKALRPFALEARALSKHCRDDERLMIGGHWRGEPHYLYLNITAGDLRRAAKVYDRGGS